MLLNGLSMPVGREMLAPCPLVSSPGPDATLVGIGTNEDVITLPHWSYQEFSEMKFVVTQIGARRGYAVPEILEQAGLLECFYTDLCGSVGLGAALASMRRLPWIGSGLSRLAARKIPASVLGKTRTFGGSVAKNALRSVFGNSNPVARFRNHLRFDRCLGQAMIGAGYGEATHVFSMLAEASPFLIEARLRGLKVVNEVYILISTERIVAEERKAFPDWENTGQNFDAVRREFYQRDPLLTETDFAICPSEAVRDDLVVNHGFDAAKTAVVPYGMNPKWLELEPKPQRGRVLFVGTADLRKGIHYLARAANLLVARGFTGEFRVAGNVTEPVRRHPECKHLTFLGRVPRDRIHEEFQAADIFVLPSLAEGSAEVIYEALAACLPVVTTHAAGSVARNGIEGRIVPERDAAALAEAIQQLTDDRVLRDGMAEAARERAKDFTWACYGERLIVALSMSDG